MVFPSEKGRFSLHKKRLACVTAISAMIYGCTRQIGVFKSIGKEIFGRARSTASTFFKV